MRMLALLPALALFSCHTGSSNTIAGALVTSSVALAASGANRAAGGCYAVCQQGEQCNEKTGLCEVLPCRGLCAPGQSCEEGFFGVKCLPGTALSVSASKLEPPPPPPVDESAGKKAPPVPDAAKP
jgi:hypothetical protein